MSNLVRIKMEIEFDFNPETGEYFPINQKVINDKKTSKSPKPTVSSSNEEPNIKLLDNKLQLNDAAIELLQAQPEDRISIKYTRVDGVFKPTIGKDVTFGTSGGNKLNKNKSISFRGKANEKLSEYGNIFTLKEKSEGIFIMVGNAEPNVVEDKNIQITEDESDNDLAEVNLDESLDEGTEVISFEDLEL